jgi:hypothetical protein
VGVGQQRAHAPAVALRATKPGGIGDQKLTVKAMRMRSIQSATARRKRC